MVRPAEAPRRPVEGTPIQFETIRRENSPPVTRARNRLRSQRTRVSTQPVTEVIRNRAVSRQIYHNMHIVRTPNNIEHNSMVLRSHVAHMDQLEQQDAMRQALPNDGTQPRRKAKPRGIFTNAQKRRTQRPQCPVGSFNKRTLHPRPSLLNIAQGPLPGPSTVPACDESSDVLTMVSGTQSGGFWRPDLSTHSSSSSVDDTATDTQTTAKRMASGSSQKHEIMLTSNIKAEVRAKAERRRAMLLRKMDSSESSGCSSKDADKERSTTRYSLERDTPNHTSSEQSSDVTVTSKTSESDIDFSVLHRPSDLSLSELPEHGPVRGKPHTRRWYKSLGKGPRPWSSSSESTDEGKASSEGSFRSISSVGSNFSHKSNDVNLPLVNESNHNLPTRNLEENNTFAEESTSGMQTKCRNSMVKVKSNQDLQTRSPGLALNENDAYLHTGNNSIVAYNTAAGLNSKDMQTSMQATDAASFGSSQSLKRKECDDMRIHGTRNGTKKKKIEIKWKRPPPNLQHLDSHRSDREMIKQDCQPSTSKVPSRTLTGLAPTNRSNISSDGREDELVDNNIRADIDGETREKEDSESCDNIWVNNTAKDGDMKDKEDAESSDNISVNKVAKVRDMRDKEDAESSDNTWVNNTPMDRDNHVMKSKSDEGWVYIIIDKSIGIHTASREKTIGEIIQDMQMQSRTSRLANREASVHSNSSESPSRKTRDNTLINNTTTDRFMKDKEDAESRDNIWINNITKDGDTKDKEDAKCSDNIWVNNTAKDGDMKDKEDAESSDNISVNKVAKVRDMRDKEDAESSDNTWVNNTPMDRDNHVMKSKSDEGWVYIIIDKSIGIHTASREKTIGEIIQDMQMQSRTSRLANREASLPSNSSESPSRKTRDNTLINNTTTDRFMKDKEDAESRDNIWINNITKDGDTKDKEDAKCSDNIWVNNTAKDGDMKDKEDAESSDNISVNKVAKVRDMRDKEDAESSDNTWVNNTPIDGDNHVMKSKSDEGWVYIIIDKSIGIHTASREKSIGEIIQDMQMQSRTSRLANREASVPSNSFESPSRKRKLDFTISSETKKKKIEVKWKQPQSHSQQLELKIPADESRRQVDLPSTSTMPCPEQVAKVVEEGINLVPRRTENAYNTRSAVKRKRGSEKDDGEGMGGGGKHRRC